MVTMSTRAACALSHSPLRELSCRGAESRAKGSSSLGAEGRARHCKVARGMPKSAIRDRSAFDDSPLQGHRRIEGADFQVTSQQIVPVSLRKNGCLNSSSNADRSGPINDSVSRVEGEKKVQIGNPRTSGSAAVVEEPLSDFVLRVMNELRDDKIRVIETEFERNRIGIRALMEHRDRALAQQYLPLVKPPARPENRTRHGPGSHSKLACSPRRGSTRAGFDLTRKTALEAGKACSQCSVPLLSRQPDGVDTNGGNSGSDASDEEQGRPEDKVRACARELRNFVVFLARCKNMMHHVSCKV